MACEIQVYGTDWCGLTRRVREYLTNSRLPHDYFDIERNADAQQFMLAMNDGHRRLPLVVVRHRVMLDPTMPALQRVLSAQGFAAITKVARRRKRR